jgi:hypothetical protein
MSLINGGPGSGKLLRSRTLKFERFRWVNKIQKFPFGGQGHWENKNRNAE